MDLLIGAEFRESLINSVQNAKASVLILSAFIKEKALLWFSEHLSDDIDVTLVTRWKCQDLLSGASDLKCFELCFQNNWKFAIDINLHSKIFLIDSRDIFLGSANLTQKGLHLSDDCNFEAGTKFRISEIDCSRLNKYVQSCIYIDWEQYKKIKQFVENNIKPEKIVNQWPKEIMSYLNSNVEHLWVKDMIFYSPKVYINNDIVEEIDVLRLKFKNERLFKWLLIQFSNNNNVYLNFGKVTALLHNSLLDDPRPYRMTVKDFVYNIFEWIRYLELDEIGIQKFNHTEALYLK